MKQKDLNTNIPTEGVPLAIIGIGCIFPQAEDHSAYWTNIREGVDTITDIPSTHWRMADYFNPDPKSPDMTYAKRGGFLSSIPFNPMEYNIPPSTMEAIDTSQLLGLVAAGNALNDAGYGSGRNFNRERVSVILGVTGTLELVIPLGARLGHPHWRTALRDAGVDDTTAEDVIQRISESYVPWQENSFPGLLGNVVAGRISKHFDLGGTNCVVDAACASSLSALHLASMELATGKSDMVVTGGIDTFNDIFMYMCFSKTPALSPTGNAKPFDADGDGTILGEGLGIIVIKRLADAERDKDRIYAVIRGVGSASDGKGEAIYTPSVAGQKKAILDAYMRAKVTPESIDLIEAHGTGTKVGDAVEVSALRDIYGEAGSPWCALGSVKSQIGHTKASAGIAGLIKAAMALHHKVIPPTIKVKKPLNEVSAGRTPFYITTDKRPWIARCGAPRRAAVSAFGFGGSNFHTVLEEYKPDKKITDWDGNVQILAFSGSDITVLEKALTTFSCELAWPELREKAAKQRSDFDLKAPCRLALVVERYQTNLALLCSNSKNMLNKYPDTSWSSPDGAYYATGSVAGKLGILFPGQGSQYIGMLRDLACCFPGMFETLATAEVDFSIQGSTRLIDLIYPATAFEINDMELQEKALRSTDVAQPAIGAVTLGTMRVLQTFGVEPEIVAGHSYGELTALCVAGRLNENSFHALSRLRGKLMASKDGDKGGMLAVTSSIADIRRMLEEEKLSLVIANCNAPSQAVLSGSSAEIEHAISACINRNIIYKQLPVAAAFHSSLVAEAADPLLDALANIPFSSSKIPVFSNTTASEYPASATKAKKLLAEQLAKPVEFVAEIESMYMAGVKTFLEVGPGSRLSNLVKSILGEKAHSAVSVDASSGKRSGIVDLARCLAQLAVLGHGVSLIKWDSEYHPQPQKNSKKPTLTIPLCGANYVKPRQKRPPIVSTRSDVNTSPPPNTSVSVATAKSVNGNFLSESIKIAREGMTVLHKIQEETAQLHRKFLEGQEIAGRTIQTLLEQQQRFHQGSVPFSTSLTNSAPNEFDHSSTTLATQIVQSIADNASCPPMPSVPTTDLITETLLSVVSEKTGYPVEMLELEMGMDSDLGIDSIKRVEILSALQERLPGSPTIGPEHLGTLHTLGEIARHLGAGSVQSASIRNVHPQPTAPTTDLITETLLSVVSEKTGYPVEMLELEMGMDSDLGIDSIKRVEILSALQERLPGSPTIGPEHLGTLHTLGEIARYLGAGSVQSASIRNVHPQPTAPTTDLITETLLSVVSEKTGYPVEMLELEMGMDSDLGIDSIKRVEILSALQERLPGSPTIGPEHLGTLHTLGEIARYLGAGSVQSASIRNVHPQPTAPTTDLITETLLSVVSEKTGYPVEMLELEMGMDSDLGIDSIKRVEILSALQERLPGSPTIGPEHLGTLHTLGEIARYLGAGSVQSASIRNVHPQPTAPTTDLITETLLSVVSEKTGYPVEMLELEMGMDSDLGIDSIKRVEILSALQERLPGSPTIGPEHLGTLHTLGEIARHLSTNTTSTNMVPLPSSLVDKTEPSVAPHINLSRGTVSPVLLDYSRDRITLRANSIIWITDDGSHVTRGLSAFLTVNGFDVRVVKVDESIANLPADNISGLIIFAPIEGTDDSFLENTFLLIKKASTLLQSNAEKDGAFICTVSRLDGAFGFGKNTSIVDPVSGGLAGIVKTVAREWPKVNCKAIDLGMFPDSAAIVNAIADELFIKNPIEVGLTKSGRFGLQLIDLPSLTSSMATPIQPDDVVIVTGGGRGVTAETAIALSNAYRPILVLLGRSPEPIPEPPWLVPLTDESIIKRALIEHATEKLHPKTIEERYRTIIAGRELRTTLARIKASGGSAVYRTVDIRDKEAVILLLNSIRKEYGAIRGIVHGAGIIADRLIIDKTKEQFAQVYSTKVGGLRTLLAATLNDDLRFISIFGSTTGRFGRSGQVDYAVANEVLNKLAQTESRHRPGCRVVCINWGPWDGGMVTSALKKVFSSEGVGLIPLQAGGELFVREIAATDNPTEIVILAGKELSSLSIGCPTPIKPLIEAFRLTLTVDDYPFIRSHVIDGKAVLPVAMIVEWLAHGALHGNPGFRFHGYNDLRICKGVVFEQNTACTLQVMAGRAEKRDSLYFIPVELRGSTEDGRSVLHARAEILLATKLPEGIRSIVDLPTTPYAQNSGVIYDQDRLFHGPDLHGIEQIGGCSAKGIAALVKAAPLPATWVKKPLRSIWITDPLVIDSAFQLMILWSFERFGSGSLPSFAARYRQFQETFPREGVQIVIRVTAERNHAASADIEFLDRNNGKLIARLEDYECVIDPSLQQAFRRNQFSQASGCVELEAA